MLSILWLWYTENGYSCCCCCCWCFRESLFVNHSHPTDPAASTLPFQSRQWNPCNPERSYTTFCASTSKIWEQNALFHILLFRARVLNLRNVKEEEKNPVDSPTLHPFFVPTASSSPLSFEFTAVTKFVWSVSAHNTLIWSWCVTVHN